MTRKEEIRNKAKNKYPYIKGLPQTLAHQEIFIESAEWADKTMVEKACEWLGDTDIHNFEELEDDGNCYLNYERFINAFKKAMEE